MKPNFKTFPLFQLPARTFLIAIAMLGLSMSYTLADVVNATYITGAEVPVSSNDFTAVGKTVNIALNFAPTPGTQLIVVQNTSPAIIRGTFSNLAQGQTVALSFGGITYHFVADYHGGKGNDLVLLWTSGEELIPAAALQKLDAQIVLALKKSRGQAPFDKPTSLEPNIPVKDGSRILVDIQGRVSRELLNQVALAGGQVIKGSETVTAFRAMIPLSQIVGLAGRSDVTSIAPARLSVTSKVKLQ